MKDLMRITLVVFVLIGGTMSFGFWSLQQFDNALENLSAASYLAVFPLVREISTTTTTTSVVATSTLAIFEASSTISSTSSNQGDIDPKFQLIFSPKKNIVYIGCTYEISWLASTTIKSLEVALIDAGPRKLAGPITGGLDKKNNIEANLQSLKWKVGVVWPGEYLISISSVNDVIIEEKSQIFKINEMSSGLDKKEQKNLCEKTGG